MFGSVTIGDADVVVDRISAKRGERARALRKVKVSCRGVQVRGRRTTLRRQANTDKLSGLVVRKISEENSVDDGANTNRGADSEAEGGDDAGGKTRRAA